MQESEFLPIPTDTERADCPLEEAAVKTLVRHRDGYRCRLCRVAATEHIELTGRTLDVHRIVPGSEYTVDGCVTLCQKCHGLMPRSKYGTSKTSRNFLFRIRDNDPLALALEAYVEKSRPKTTRQAIILAALEDYLRGKGYLDDESET